MRMVGKLKRHACPYGCCDSDFPGSGKRKKRVNKKRVKAREKRNFAKEIENGVD